MTFNLGTQNDVVIIIAPYLMGEMLQGLVQKPFMTGLDNH